MLSRALCVSAFVSLVAAHATITGVKGANGIMGMGMGIDPTTPRNGILPVPYERDTSIIRDVEMQSGRVGPCGRTSQKGPLDMAKEMEAASAGGLPSTTSNGEIQMILHQVNQDGAGPFSCDMSADGGNSWQPAVVNKNVPGAILGLSLAAAKDWPLNVQMPAGMKCAGGPDGNACIARCRNATPAGPFGSCAVFTDAGDARDSKKATGAAPAATAGTPNRGGLGSIVGILGLRRSSLNHLDLPVTKRALGKPEDFAKQDARDAEIEKQLIDEFNKNHAPAEKKRAVRSRVVGSLSGYWI